MATALEQAFIVAVRNAQGIRQQAYAAATATYAGVPANYAAYITALTAADVAYAVSVNTAATTAGISPYAVDDVTGQIYGNTATILT